MLYPHFIALLLVLCSACSVFAHNSTISPSSGPASGGTEVTIAPGTWPHGVCSGSTAALETRRVDEHRLAVTNNEMQFITHRTYAVTA